MVDRELNALLWQWGRARTSENLEIKPPPAFKYYVAPASTELVNRYDSAEVEALGLIIDEHLNRRQTEALKCRYRYKLKKRRSAKHMKCSRAEYLDYFDSAIRELEKTA